MKLGILGLVGMVALASACADTTANRERGVVVVSLTDAPFSADSVKEINIFITRVDAKIQDTDSAEVAKGATDDSAGRGGWQTLATPNAVANLVNLQNGVSTFLGLASIEVGNYKSLRLIIDPARSNVVLKTGQVLSSTSNPGVVFPSAAKSGIKVRLLNELVVSKGDTTKTLIDFDAAESFIIRGNTIASRGLLFKPVLKAKSSRGK